MKRHCVALIGASPGDLPYRLDEGPQLDRGLGGEQQLGTSDHQDVRRRRQPRQVGQQRGQRGPVVGGITRKLQRRPDLVEEAVRRPSTVATQDPHLDAALPQHPAELAGVSGGGVEQVQPGPGRPAQGRQLRRRIGGSWHDPHIAIRATARILFIASSAATLYDSASVG